VESCEVASEKINGSKLSGYHVILADTILFPEGGGQVKLYSFFLLLF